MHKVRGLYYSLTKTLLKPSTLHTIDMFLIQRDAKWFQILSVLPLSNLLTGFSFVDTKAVYFPIDNLYSMIVLKDGGSVNNIMGTYKENVRRKVAHYILDS